MTKTTAEIIKEGIIANYNGEMIFPEWLKILIGRGIERYYADLVAAQVTYYVSDGTTITEKLPHPMGFSFGVEFSEKNIVDALRTIQRKEIKYPELLDRITKAGTVSYTVFIQGKMAHYIGAKGEIYFESFPQSISQMIEEYL